MTSIEKETLQNGLCEGCDCAGFNPQLTYAVNKTTKVVTVTDASEFGTGDSFKKVIVHVYDKDGNEKHGVITTAEEGAAVDVSTLNLSSIDITATVISTNGCKADLGIYNIGSTDLTGSLKHTANQGSRT